MRLPLQEILEAANQGDEYTLAWIQRIARYGVTAQLAQDLNKKLEKFQMSASFHFDAKLKRLEPRFWFPQGITEDREAQIALEIVSLLGEKRLDGLKRCSLTECRKYYVGGPRAKWCSENCGSKYRVRKKRKLDRERQML